MAAFGCSRTGHVIIPLSSSQSGRADDAGSHCLRNEEAAPAFLPAPPSSLLMGLRGDPRDPCPPVRAAFRVQPLVGQPYLPSRVGERRGRVRRGPGVVPPPAPAAREVVIRHGGL